MQNRLQAESQTGCAVIHEDPLGLRDGCLEGCGCCTADFSRLAGTAAPVCGRQKLSPPEAERNTNRCYASMSAHRCAVEGEIGLRAEGLLRAFIRVVPDKLQLAGRGCRRIANRRCWL